MAKSTVSSPRRKARKFPLNLHSTGQYRKRINGRDYYFGVDPDEALKRYQHDLPYLQKGLRPPPMDEQAFQLRDLCNSFLTHKKSQLATGEITNRTFQDYYRSCEQLLAHFGKTLPVSMLNAQSLLEYRAKLSTTRGPVSLGNEITRVRVLLNYAFALDYIERPIKCGEFKKPSRKVLRRQRAAGPKKLFDRGESLLLIENANVQMRAMVLLALNGGLGNRECAELDWPAVNLATGWMDCPRVKTGAPRRFPLWPETLAALRAVQACWRAPRRKDYHQLVFVTRYGGPWFSDDKANPVSREFRKLQQQLGIHRPGRGFYSLRHTFQTVADESRDFPAVRQIMGHADGDDIADHYREGISDDRLRRVVDHVHSWLYGEGDGDE